jgi:hypothetical protein
MVVPKSEHVSFELRLKIKITREPSLVFRDCVIEEERVGRLDDFF